MITIQDRAPAQEQQPPVLPATEEEFLHAYFQLRYRQRSAYIQSVALTYKDDLVPLLQELFITQPAIVAVPIPLPAKQESDLNADGGNPNPEIETVPLPFPQTTASSRYVQYSSALTMATTVAQQGSKRAVTLLLDHLNHPYQAGKKRLINTIASLATDEDIRAAAATSAPAVRDALVAALTHQKRKDLARDILGKPRIIAKKETHTPVTTRLRKELEQSKEYDRDAVWNRYYGILDVVNQPGKNVCESGETLKDVILTLQEQYPPLFPWDNSSPGIRNPKLATLIQSSLVSFLQHDAERTMRILQRTSYQIKHDGKDHSVEIPSGLINTKKARRFWCRRDADDTLLQNYALGLMAIGDGELVEKGLIPTATLFSCCRGDTVALLVRFVLALAAAEEDKAKKSSHLDSLFKFAVEGIDNLVHRVTSCSMVESKIIPTWTFYETLKDLMTRLFTTAFSALRVHSKDDSAFATRLYNNIIKPLLEDQTIQSWGLPKPSHLRSFPPLGETLFEQIRAIFKSKIRNDSSVKLIVEDLFPILAPCDASVYAISDEGYKQPFSSVPTWNNNAVFEVCIANCLNKTGKAMIQLDNYWISHFSTLAPSLTQHQRDNVVEWIAALPSFKPLINKDQGIHVFPMLQALCTNVDLRHQIVAPLVFCDKKEKEVDLGDSTASWAAYVDIRIPDVRALLVKETLKPAFEDRLKWLTAILDATRFTNDVGQWIITLRWLIPKIRNEIQPNLQLLASSLLPNDGCVPRQYLDSASLDQAGELVKMYLVMDAQNSAAVTPVSGIGNFIDSIAAAALARFVAQTSHPFFEFGTEIFWRRRLTQQGEQTALTHYRISFYEPQYSKEAAERDEESEIRRRQVVAKEKELLKTEGGLWGRYRIPEGGEEAYAQGMINVYHKRWLSVKAVMDPDVQGDDIQAFKTAQKQVWLDLCKSILTYLGWRWKKSPTLVRYLDEVIDLLENAPTKTIGQDTILDWDKDDFLPKAVSYVQSVRNIYIDDDWIRANVNNLPWYTRFRNLRLVSTDFAPEVAARIEDCKLKNSKRDNDRYEDVIVQLLGKSSSAIHLQCVLNYISDERPDLLTAEQISMTKSIPGLFNQVETVEPWDQLFVKNPSLLTPCQCELFKARHLSGMTDAATPFQTRVQHAQSFIAIPTTTVENVAGALCTPSLPSRIIEALLMYLPTLREPASTLPLLFAPVYIQSHLARTSIHAVENALKYVPLQQVPDFILPLFPSVGKKQYKVTVQKEGVRLALASMQLLADNRISALTEDLLAREDLNNDVRVVILQSLLGLLSGPEGREQRYHDLTEHIWRILASVAHSEIHKKSGVAFVLLAATASNQRRALAPRLSNFEMMSRTTKFSATLDDLAKIVIPEGLVDRYVEYVLLPMCVAPTGENTKDQDLVDVRVLSLQLIIQNTGWVTTKNAVKLAQQWRQEASMVPLDEDKNELWPLFVLGIGRCVGEEVSGALADGRTGNTSWQELTALVQDQAETFLDTTLTRTLRRRALDRINSMVLDNRFMTQNFEKARTAGAFTGDDLDLARPLLAPGMESVTWKTALKREIAVFNPQESLTQQHIDQEGLRLLLRIAEYSGRYPSTGAEAAALVIDSLFAKVSDNLKLKKFMTRAVLEPHKDLMDWTHADTVAVEIMRRHYGLFTLKEIGTFADRLAKQDNPYFYWISRTYFAEAAKAALKRLYQDYNSSSSVSIVSTIRLDLASIVQRAQDAGYLAGPDAVIVRELLTSDVKIMCAAFPEVIGQFMHQYVVGSVNALVTGNYSGYPWLAPLCSVATFGYQAMKIGSGAKQIVFTGEIPDAGTCPATILILEHLMNGQLADLNLATFMTAHSVPEDELLGRWFIFRAKSDTDNNTSALSNKNPSSLKELDDRWSSLVGSHGYLSNLQQAVQTACKKDVSPAVLQMYRGYTAEVLSSLSKFVLMRPYIYLEFVRLVLTTPGNTFLSDKFAYQMASAFTPIRDPVQDEYSYTWAPPLSLALDLAEYLLHDVRDEAAIEGHREAQLIEQTTSQFLQKWVQQVVDTPAGKLLSDSEDVKALERRYSALVDELCQEGSGGQSIGLVLGDFFPGGAAETERLRMALANVPGDSDEEMESDSDEEMESDSGEEIESDFESDADI
ncbi:hypothetical protein EDD11_009681 [Mortierella claussenii]|nr:hypothetical protein EDD11_009681 [Mortierella claussenii]